MKANELMIGDWVMVDDIEHTHPLQVAEIFNKCGAYYATLYWDGMPDNVNPQTLVADVDKVFPIPLTKEILEKNGFIRDMFYGEWQFDLDPFPFSVVQRENNSWYLGREEHGIAHNREIIDISHVHELQHALRLCGITREIIV